MYTIYFCCSLIKRGTFIFKQTLIELKKKFDDMEGENPTEVVNERTTLAFNKNSKINCVYLLYSCSQHVNIPEIILL